MKVKEIDDDAIYLYKFEDRWLIGRNPGVDDCLCYAIDPSLSISEFTSEEWNFVSDNDWVSDFARFIFKTAETSDVYDALWQTRSLKYVSVNQTYLKLRNDVPLPTIGLGTGGMQLEASKEIMKMSLRSGYRMLGRSVDHEF